jgi:hypothetical protein
LVRSGYTFSLFISCIMPRFRLLRAVLLALFLGLFAARFAVAQVPAIQWERTLGGSGGEGFPNHSLSGGVGVRAVARPGGGWLVGALSGSPAGSGERSAPNRGGADYWLLCLDAQGRVRWDRAFGGLRTAPSAGYPTGQPAGNYFLDLYPTADGGCLLAGQSNAAANGDKSQPSRGGFDYWLVKVDSTGAKQWDVTLGGADNDGALCVRQAADGGYFVAGYSLSYNVGGDKTQFRVAAV